MATNHTENLNLCQWLATDAVLRSDFNADNQKIDAALKYMPKFLVGSYTGNGLSGADNPKSLSFSFNPMLVIVVADSPHSIVPGSVFINGQSTSDGIGNYANYSFGLNIHLTWSDGRVSWYSTEDADRQLNNADQIYRFFAFGF